MIQPGTVLNLASGGTVRVTPYLVEVNPPGDVTSVTFDMQQLKGVSREGTTVRLLDTANVVTTLGMASLDDAGQLETAIRPSVHGGVNAVQGQPTLAGTSMDVIGMPLGILAAAVLVVIGSLGPWAKVWVMSVSGTDGDGVITLALGLFAAALAIMQIRASTRHTWRSIGMGSALGICALVGMYDWATVSDRAADSELTASVGWGLQLMTLAAIGGFTLTVVDYINRNPDTAASS